MKKVYKIPEIILTKLEVEDILSASTIIGDGTDVGWSETDYPIFD